MDSSKIFIILAIATIVVPSVLATQYLVGDDQGWTTNVDYQAWAQGKEFLVGDTLVFKYSQGFHDVLKVDETGFQKCVAPANTVALTTGNDVVTLATPGKQWYICGFSMHCEKGKQKLAVTVLSQSKSPASGPSPNTTVLPQPKSPTSRPSTSTPASAATGNAVSGYYAWILAMFTILGMVMA